MRDTTIPYYTATKIIAITLRAIRRVAITKARENTNTVRIQQGQSVMIKLLLHRTYVRSNTRDTITVNLVVYIRIE